MNKVPDDLKRYPTREGRDALAARLGLKISPFSQDWEREVAEPARFADWLAVYCVEPLSDEERFSLMEMLVQCVDDMVPTHESAGDVENFNRRPGPRGLPVLDRDGMVAGTTSVHHDRLLEIADDAGPLR